MYHSDVWAAYIPICCQDVIKKSDEYDEKYDEVFNSIQFNVIKKSLVEYECQKFNYQYDSSWGSMSGKRPSAVTPTFL